MGPFISLAMTACSRIEINAAMPVAAASLSYTTIVTGLHSNHVKPLCNLQEDLNCSGRLGPGSLFPRSCFSTSQN